MWLHHNMNVTNEEIVPDIIVNVSLQGIGAMRQRCVVRSPDVQLIKVLDKPDMKNKQKTISDDLKLM